VSHPQSNQNSQLTMVLAVGLIIVVLLGALAAYAAYQVGYGQAEAEATAQILAKEKEIDGLKADVAKARSSASKKSNKSAPPPVKKSTLAAADLGLAALTQLSADQQAVAMGVLNSAVGPCEPCIKSGLSLATCAKAKGNLCKNMEGLVARTARMAAEGKSAEQITEAVKYVAGWAPVDLTGSPRKGTASAPVVVVEYSEYQCPFCKRVQGTMHELEEKYGDQVSFVFKHYPLAKHTQAKPAAIASIAAERQGKFWEYKHALFEHQRDLRNDGIFEQIAEEVGLNMDQFRKDLADPEIQAQIDVDVAQAKKVGVTGTPCFFVNGYKLKGAKPLEAFVDVIDRELADR
jgi:protein-disulfide isomerase